MDLLGRDALVSEAELPEGAAGVVDGELQARLATREGRQQDEDQAEEREDQDVAGEHVREETDGERDEPHDLAEDLERHDQAEQRRLSGREVAEREASAHQPDHHHDRQRAENEIHFTTARGQYCLIQEDPPQGDSKGRE